MYVRTCTAAARYPWLTWALHTVKDVSVILTFPKEVLSVDIDTTFGSVTFPDELQAGKSVVRDPSPARLALRRANPQTRSQVCLWTIGGIPSETPSLTGSIKLREGAKPAGTCVCGVTDRTLLFAHVVDRRVERDSYRPLCCCQRVHIRAEDS